MSLVKKCVTSKVVWIFLSCWLQNLFSIVECTCSRGGASLPSASCRKDDFIPAREDSCTEPHPGGFSCHTGPCMFSFSAGTSLGLSACSFWWEANAALTCTYHCYPPWGWTQALQCTLSLWASSPEPEQEQPRSLLLCSLVNLFLLA